MTGIGNFGISPGSMKKNNRFEAKGW